MSGSLIRGKYLIQGGEGIHSRANTIDDGALFQRDGVIEEIGTFTELSVRYPDVEVLGSPSHLVMPGLINSHHHGGLTAFQMGTRDTTLEQWTVDRIRRRNVDPYLDTLYAAMEMIECGVTTVQHLHSRANGPAKNVEASAEEIIGAYAALGMRVSYSFGVRDQNRLVYEDDAKFLKRLPADLALEISQEVLAKSLPLEAHFEIFDSLRQAHRQDALTRIQLAASNLQWCSDAALRQLRDTAMRADVPVNMHLLETKYQQEYAMRRSGTTAIEHLHSLGLLGPQLTLAHVVWATESDIRLLAQTGTNVCHNPSSNMRLRGGTAPILRMAREGVSVSIGMDDATLNDDRNLLTEMRLALRLHRTPAQSLALLSPSEVLQMATNNGAMTTGFGDRIGSLRVGGSADLVLMDWHKISRPYLDSSITPVEALVHLGSSQAVDVVVIDGAIVFEHGAFSNINRSAVLDELRLSFPALLSADEKRREHIANRIAPFVSRFYSEEGYFDADSARSQFHCTSC